MDHPLSRRGPRIHVAGLITVLALVLGALMASGGAQAASVGPSPVDLTSRGDAGAEQAVDVELAAGDTLALLDDDVATGTIEVPGQGTYLVTGAGHDTLAFQAAADFHGRATPVAYQITDSAGQIGTATYRARVVDTSNLPRIDRSAWARVPAHPRRSTGRLRLTRAAFASAGGSDAWAYYRVVDREFQAGQATTLFGLFTRDRARLTTDGRDLLAQIATTNLYAAQHVRCEAYTDYAGRATTRAARAALSTRRAAATCAALQGSGADVTVTSRGYGGSHPAVIGGTAAKRSANFRVVVLVTG